MTRPDEPYAVELPFEDWQRLLKVADLGASKQDIRILDALRVAVTNGEPPRERS